jgi:hypothetical protein
VKCFTPTEIYRIIKTNKHIALKILRILINQNYKHPQIYRLNLSEWFTIKIT